MSSSVEGTRRGNDAPGHRHKLPTVAGAANRLVCGVLIASMAAPFCFVPVQGHMINVSGSGTAHMARPIWHLMDDLKNQAKQDIEMTYRYCTYPYRDDNKLLPRTWTCALVHLAHIDVAVRVALLILPSSVRSPVVRMTPSPRSPKSCRHGHGHGRIPRRRCQQPAAVQHIRYRR